MLLLLLLAQQVDPGALAVRLAGMTAVSGYEQAAADSIAALLPHAVRDRSGSVVVRLGTGGSARLVACPLDEPGYVVGGMRPDGYLTLHRTPGRSGPVGDQQLEGQRVTVWGRRGAVPGVVAVHSVHLSRGRPAGDEPFTADNAYVDVGAASQAEVDSLGVGMLSPVALWKEPHRYGDSLLAAPVAGRRAACAALLAAAVGARAGGTTVVAFVVEQNISARGLNTVIHEYGPFAETLIVDGAAGTPGAIRESGDTVAGRALPGAGRVTRMDLPARYFGWPVETVSLADARALRARLVSWIGGGR